MSTELPEDLIPLLENAKKLVSLLEDPQPGLMGWNMLLANRIEAIKALPVVKGVEIAPETVTNTGSFFDADKRRISISELASKFPARPYR